MNFILFFNCVIELKKSIFFSNNYRCPVYSDLPSTCYLIKDPKDQCCSLPQCSGSLSPVTVTGTQTPGTSGTNLVPVGTHTQFSGSYNPQPGTGSISGKRSMIFVVFFYFCLFVFIYLFICCCIFLSTYSYLWRMFFMNQN